MGKAGSLATRDPIEEIYEDPHYGTPAPLSPILPYESQGAGARSVPWYWTVDPWMSLVFTSYHYPQTQKYLIMNMNLL